MDKMPMPNLSPQPLTASSAVSPRCNPKIILDRVRLMFGCYRKSDANDPETYIVAACAVLSRYPSDIVIAVTDPVNGLPSALQFVPTIKEIKDACDTAENRKAREVESRGWRERAASRPPRSDPPPPGPGQFTYEQAMTAGSPMPVHGRFDR